MLTYIRYTFIDSGQIEWCILMLKHYYPTLHIKVLMELFSDLGDWVCLENSSVVQDWEIKGMGFENLI